MDERHVWLTVAVGAAYVGFLVCIALFIDDVVSRSAKEWVVLPYLFGVPPLCAWGVFRRADSQS
jgi:hypothetical protein